MQPVGCHYGSRLPFTYLPDIYARAARSAFRLPLWRRRLDGVSARRLDGVSVRMLRERAMGVRIPVGVLRPLGVFLPLSEGIPLGGCGLVGVDGTLRIPDLLRGGGSVPALGRPDFSVDAFSVDAFSVDGFSVDNLPVGDLSPSLRTVS
jgi:hypothetical protein